ncbi:flagella synthesis protein FlgN [Pantoea anthophila]|uniref:flagella synthesis protein FlgN n=1 Tax=Pantoea anthophila TaxID=470931 RepID=UPI002782AEE8|nr:flagellar export chaperone FlgN [Pantoea anthophila]MDQ1213477.1 flagella synthesis protein FlgN [Pantoea anthophila]
MNDLRIILIKLQTSLEELKPVLAEELNQLNQLQLNPVTLQRLSDNKSRLLATISFFEEQRKAKESELGIIAPYHQPLLTSLWESVLAIARQNRELNMAISPLLDLQMQKALTLKNVVKKVSNTVALYSADGTSQSDIKGKAYNINI